MPNDERNTRQWAKDPQRRPPAGWKVKNWFFKTLLAKAQRTGHHPLIERVSRMKNAPRHDLVLIHELVAQAAKGDVDPASIDIDAILKEENNKRRPHENHRKT